MAPPPFPSTIQSTAYSPRSPAPAPSFLWCVVDDKETRGQVVRRARGLNPYRKPRHSTSHDLGAADDGDRPKSCIHGASNPHCVPRHKHHADVEWNRIEATSKLLSSSSASRFFARSSRRRRRSSVADRCWGTGGTAWGACVSAELSNEWHPHPRRGFKTLAARMSAWCLGLAPQIDRAAFTCVVGNEEKPPTKATTTLLARRPTFFDLSDSHTQATATHV